MRLFNQASTLTRSVTLILVIAILPVDGIYAQKPQPPDTLIEASKYLERGEQEIDCSAGQAERWFKEAQDRLNSFRSSAPIERDTAAVLSAEAAFGRVKAKTRVNALDQAAKKIPKLLNERRVSSALRELNRVKQETPTCDQRFKQWEIDATSRRSAAGRLVKLGDDTIFSDPRSAKRFYSEALKIDAEYPEITAKLTSADAAIRASRKGSPVAKAIGITLLVAGLVAAAYAADRYEKRQRGYYQQPLPAYPRR
jgi:hypothetical protein